MAGVAEKKHMCVMCGLRHAASAVDAECRSVRAGGGEDTPTHTYVHTYIPYPTLPIAIAIAIPYHTIT